MITRILVTGVGGQLGRALRGMAEAGDVAPAAGGFEWLFTDLAELDITDPQAVKAFFAAEKPGVVVNCAAYTDVNRAESERDAAFRVNRDAVRHLAGASQRHGAALIHISTDFVFDGRATEPYKEGATPAPLNVYGESKLAGERAVLESGCRGAVVRTSWLYSPWGRNFVLSILGAAEKAIERAAANADRAGIEVVADQFGCPTSAGSLAAAIVKMIPALVSGKTSRSGMTPAAEPCPADIYHFCDSGVTSRAGFAEEILCQAGLACRVNPVASAEYSGAPKRPAYSALDTSKISRDFGIVPPPWQEALKLNIEKYLND